MVREPLVTVGWDVGGVQVKAARVVSGAGVASRAQTAVRPFEIWRGRERLPQILREVAGELDIGSTAPSALTMTAELSDAFRSKREGVLFVMDAMREAFPESPVSVLDCRGELVALSGARLRPLEFAATNWVASALFAASRIGDCILVDVGSTTTDIVPIRAGRLVCEGRTDLARLSAGELVYTGVLRTNPNTLTSAVPVRGRFCRVAAEHFAVMADAYVLMGRLGEEEYTCSTPDGRDTSPDCCAERLARLVCGDREMLGDAEITSVARYLVERQMQVVSEGLLQVLSRCEAIPPPAVAAAGAGAFVAAEVANRLGLDVLPAGSSWGEEGVALPAAAVACLLAVSLEADGG
jgi:(4-(4-[2-(gamma-L-glutamylamino)ethyl]phenoxymethyl)furan-2-yl)methanamine synthase